MAEANPMDAIDFDRSVIGIDVDVGTHEVSKEQMVAYAKAVGEINPLYLDEEAAKAAQEAAEQMLAGATEKQDLEHARMQLVEAAARYKAVQKLKGRKG